MPVTEIAVSDNVKDKSEASWLVGSPVPSGILRLAFPKCAAPSKLMVEWKGAKPESVQIEGVPDDNIANSISVENDVLTLQLTPSSVEKLSGGGSLTIIDFLR
eukprot:TRINITY_DN647_c6_g1_i2.p1 TRINITY_DN647_c6_g1~~TRINITY_DN647_c6_g1_i2.p1  ORF type:complete len:119 (+),score=22.65 TRINITY_DN647_c6_g1_i2:49-357(+)